jgi:hypothetical protein
MRDGLHQPIESVQIIHNVCMLLIKGILGIPEEEPVA